MDNRPDDPQSSPESSRPRRAPPTIDLEASEVSGPGGGNKGRAGWRFGAGSWPSMTAIAPWLAAGVSGALAAVLVIACALAFGWLGDGAQGVVQADANASAIAGLSSRLNALEARPSLALNSDSGLPARLDSLEKSIATVRGEIAGLRARFEKLAAQLDGIKSAPPPPAPAAAPDLAPIEERVTQLERGMRAESEKIAQNASRPADDTALRRVVVASLLANSVRQGEPFAPTLAAAKALATDPAALKPLEDFASTGVPNPASLTRELLNLVPKLSPPAQEPPTTGVVDRLKAGAAKLVRIERSDVTGNDRGAIVARITAAAVRNDLAEARREMEQLSPEDRKPAQAWLDKAKARDAALAASHHFADEAMTALAKPAP
jgi:hypothetical protein